MFGHQGPNYANRPEVPTNPLIRAVWSASAESGESTVPVRPLARSSEPPASALLIAAWTHVHTTQMTSAGAFDEDIYRSKLEATVSMENPERLLTPGEVALMFRVDPKTVTRWASAGRIGSIRTPRGAPQVPRVRGR